MVSIHAPHEGERPKFDKSNYSKAKFQSTLPTRGERLRRERFRGILCLFQSTLPTRGSDTFCCCMCKG